MTIGSLDSGCLHEVSHSTRKPANSGMPIGLHPAAKADNHVTCDKVVDKEHGEICEHVSIPYGNVNVASDAHAQQ